MFSNVLMPQAYSESGDMHSDWTEIVVNLRCPVQRQHELAWSEAEVRTMCNPVSSGR